METQRFTLSLHPPNAQTLRDANARAAAHLDRIAVERKTR